LLVCALVTLKTTYINYGPHLSWGYLLLSLVLTLHNLATAYYAFQLAKWYLSMSVKNMHAVEECEVGNIYDKAKYHKLWSHGEGKKFYYTRPGGAWNNIAEMIGTRNLLYWLLPVPHYGR